MKQKYIPALIMLLAGAVTSILDIINRTPRLESLKKLLLVLILFYIIGLLAKAIIKKAASMKGKEGEEQNLAEVSGQEENEQEERQEEIRQEKNLQDASNNQKAGAVGKK
jgi:hypothetical protein